MTTISQLYLSNRKLNFFLGMSCLYALTLLLLRAKVTHSLFLFFLIWNLFLAIVPYGLSTYLLTFTPTSHLKKFLFIFIWLAFIPNSFYIITDFVHLTHREATLFYYDLIIIAVHAFLGFIFGILSIQQMVSLKIFSTKIKLQDRVLPLVCYLIGIGIYIGRELRYNSWDIIQKPFELLSDLTLELTQFKTIGFALSYGSLIYVTLLIVQQFNSNKSFKK